MQSVQAIYDRQVAGGLVSDPAQQAVAARLDDLAARLRKARHPLARLLPPREAPRGLYLWGDVGRGKSMLVDMFVAANPDLAIRRVHFHAFMRDVHAALHEARAASGDDPLKDAADAVTEGLTLLALDELEIIDIVDAMIVGRVFERIFARGIAVVATSNRPPEDLYQDGLKRDLFLPFVDLIARHTDVVRLATDEDYRRTGKTDDAHYIIASDDEARARMDRLWHHLAPSRGQPAVLARAVTVLKSGNLVRASFDTLCRLPLATADYQALADMAEVLFIDDVPLLTERDRDAVRRFMLLIDTLYDARRGLVVSAAVPPDDLNAADTFAEPFRRTASRLHEMCGPNWPGRPAAT